MSQCGSDEVFEVERLRDTLRNDIESWKVEMERRRIEDQRRTELDALFESQRQRWEAFKAGLTEREQAILAAEEASAR